MKNVVTLEGYPSHRESALRIEWVCKNGETIWIPREYIARERGTSIEINGHYASTCNWSEEKLNQESGAPVIPVMDEEDYTFCSTTMSRHNQMDYMYANSVSNQFKREDSTKRASSVQKNDGAARVMPEEGSASECSDGDKTD